MLYVEIGRLVAARNLKDRHNKAIITGIIDNVFFVVFKQDKTYEIVRANDIVLEDKVYDLKDLENDNCEFYNLSNVRQTNDFDRFIERKTKEIGDKIAAENGLYY
ncbi:hypothetical protein HERIO_882 [Hepatospora eriocheir]|uniref:Uncharacterized protein n=1 Tax=Hepatospora eriocheir TaxID=1081669 RepID=A0A1X0QBR8_9MICR|nr:hypothetical protein HERIO_882 [Hepatospora eriocheir]